MVIQGAPARVGAADQLGLEQAVDGLGQGVIERIADRADRRGRPDVGQSLPVADGCELRAGIRMTPQALKAGTARPAGHLQGIEHHLCAHVGCHPPSDTSSGSTRR